MEQEEPKAGFGSKQEQEARPASLASSLSGVACVQGQGREAMALQQQREGSAFSKYLLNRSVLVCEAPERKGKIVPASVVRWDEGSS